MAEIVVERVIEERPKKKPKKKVSTTLFAQYYCPGKCGNVLAHTVRGTLVCTRANCEYQGIEFVVPTIELERA